MELLWIPISMFAGLIQAVRTAAQKDLNAHLSTVVTTYVRSIFGFPFILAYLACLVIFLDEALPRVHIFFFLNACGAAITQLLATAFLIHLFTLRNFAVGTNLTRTDVMMTAIIGSLFFSEDLSISGWIAITLTVIGVIIMSVAKSNIGASLNSRGDLANALLSRSTLIGLLTGFCFCLSYLFLREASLSLEGSFILRAATTLVCVLGIQVLIGLVWLYRFEPEAVAKIGGAGQTMHICRHNKRARLHRLVHGNDVAKCILCPRRRPGRGHLHHPDIGALFQRKNSFLGTDRHCDHRCRHFAVCLVALI